MSYAEGQRFANVQLDLKKTASTPSQDVVFQKALHALPEKLRNQVVHASGGLPDARGLSDVDISYHTPTPHELLPQLPEGTVAERRDDEHSVYSLPGYPREVNLYATLNKERAARAPAHRATQIALQQQYPALTEDARKLKAGGLGTEKAWAQVLGAPGDPFEKLIDKDKMLALAQALQQKTAKAHKLSRRMDFRGLKISIETDKGESRHWYDPHSKEHGTTKMKCPYGYARRTQGTDGDHVDTYIGPNENAKNVYIVNQMKKPKDATKKRWTVFDEQKCMLGFDSATEAKKAYLYHYNDDRFFGSMTTMPFEEFKEKVLGTFTRPQKIAMIKNAIYASVINKRTGRYDTYDLGDIERGSPEMADATAHLIATDTQRQYGVPFKDAPMKPIQSGTVQRRAIDRLSGNDPLPSGVTRGVSWGYESKPRRKMAALITKLAANMAIGDAMRLVRQSLKGKNVDQAYQAARQAVSSGAIEAPMLKRLSSPSAGITSHEAELWRLAGRRPQAARPVASRPVTSRPPVPPPPATPPGVDPGIAQSWAKAKQQRGWA